MFGAQNFLCCFGGAKHARNDGRNDESSEVTPTGKGEERGKAGGFLVEDGAISGIHNSASKFAPDKEVTVSDEPFEQRLERAMRAEEEAVRRLMD